MRHYLESASKRMDDNNFNDSGLMGAFASVHSCFSAQSNDLPNALKFANQALDTLSPEQTFLKDYALNYKVLATSMIHSPAEAKAVIEDFELMSETPENRSLMRVNAIKLMFNWSQANLKILKLSGKIVIDIGKQERDWWIYKMGCYYMAQYHYMKNQISEVYSYIDAGIDCFYNAGPAWTLQLYYGGVLAAIADNDLSKAGRYLMSAKKFIKLNKLEIFEGYLRAFEVEFALITNDVEKAWGLERTATYSMHPPIKYYYIPQFTQIKLYIIKGDPELMKEANDLIQQYKKTVGNLLYAKIQITLLEAVWYAKSGLNEKAIGTLIEVLTFTPEKDYIRVYLDMGKPVHKMILALPEEQKQMPLVRNILMAFKHQEDIQSKKSESINLTPKEMELMELVSSGMQNKEIADQLCLSDSTIKTYLYKIYQKLEVKNRFSAIRKVKELQLLTH
jgi:DNA-binding CsgD family transcriptional regulator